MSNQSRSIIQLVDSRQFGGIESHILNLSLWLKQQGEKNQVLFLHDYGDHPLKQALGQQGIAWNTLDSYWALFKLLRQTPCILATHGYKAGIIGRLIARLSGCKVVSTFHSGDLGEGKLRYYSQLDIYTAPLAHQAISVSPEIASRLPCDSLQLPNFVKTQGLPLSHAKSIAFVGRLSHEKGPDTFAKLTLNVQQALGIKLDTKVYGDGPMRAKLASDYPHLQLFGHVDMQDHWQEVGLLCITSRSEGLPLVALEAMARGIPVVSFRLGALPQVICSGRNGWLVKQRDQQGFQAAIIHWLTLSAIQRRELGLAARNTIRKRFSSEVVVPKIVAAYQSASTGLSD